MEVWELVDGPTESMVFDQRRSKIIVGITARCNDQLGAFRWRRHVLATDEALFDR